MSKVGILSMQRIFNYGSFLQAYGLKSMLEELNNEVEFVDYHPEDCLIQLSSRKGILRKVEKVMEVFCGHAPLKEKIRFIRYKKNYAKNYYHFLEINKNYNFTPELDLLVIGSDEVYNCVQDNTNVGYSQELFGVGNHARRLVSYAASCGNMTIEKLKHFGVKEEVAGWLFNFDAISVRDINTRNVVKGLIGKTPEYHLDPVLVYDYLGKCQKIPKNVSETNYMILYGYSSRFNKKECMAIRAYANRHGLKVYCIGGVQDCCDKFIDCSPFEVIAYFKNAEIVVTDTFHGTILSVITHQTFVTFIRNQKYGNLEKLMDLLDRLHLNDRAIHDFEELDRLLEMSIDYCETDSIILEGRKLAYEYLERELQLCM